MKISYIFLSFCCRFCFSLYTYAVLRCFILLTAASLLITSIFFRSLALSFWGKFQYFFDGSCFLHQLNYFAFDWFSTLDVSKVAKAVAYLTDSAGTYFLRSVFYPRYMHICRIDQFWSSTEWAAEWTVANQ